LEFEESPDTSTEDSLTSGLSDQQKLLLSRILSGSYVSDTDPSLSAPRAPDENSIDSMNSEPASPALLSAPHTLNTFATANSSISAPPPRSSASASGSDAALPGPQSSLYEDLPGAEPIAVEAIPVYDGDADPAATVRDLVVLP
jgi:hypothetical protein